MSLPKSLIDLARDASIDADKFAAIVQANYRQEDRAAEQAFVTAFLKMKPKLPIIDERGHIEYRDGRKGTYALNEDIQLVIEPILLAHGFMLTFETEHPSPNAIRVMGLLTHRKGHTRRSAFEAPADTSGGKTAPQGRGSIVSYGHRYTTLDLLNLITRNLDNDGETRTAGKVLSAATVAQFPALVVAAVQGYDPLSAVWRELREELRDSIPVEDWQTLKEIAQLKDAVI